MHLNYVKARQILLSVVLLLALSLPLQASGLTPPELTSSEASRGTKWAIVIGISNYPVAPEEAPVKFNPLQHARHDAQAMCQTLVEDYGYDPRHIAVLIDKAATHSRILQYLNFQRVEVNALTVDIPLESSPKGMSPPWGEAWTKTPYLTP